MPSSIAHLDSCVCLMFCKENSPEMSAKLQQNERGKKIQFQEEIRGAKTGKQTN